VFLFPFNKNLVILPAHKGKPGKKPKIDIFAKHFELSLPKCKKIQILVIKDNILFLKPISQVFKSNYSILLGYMVEEMANIREGKHPGDYYLLSFNFQFLQG